MRTRQIALAAASTMAFYACAESTHDTSDARESPEVRETIDNLVLAGFPRNQIIVIDDVVHVDLDTVVSLQSSREMVRTGNTSKEQYRTTNIVGANVTKICINGSTYTGVFSEALDRAIRNYDDQPLTFSMARAPSTGCKFTMDAVIVRAADFKTACKFDPPGGCSSFPANGLPYNKFTLSDDLNTKSINVIEHIITHEIGHALGFRHSDYYNTSISCSKPGSETAGDFGVTLIPGTPDTAVVGGSVMNACFRDNETGEFTATDLVALKTLYGATDVSPKDDILWRNQDGTIAIWFMDGGTNTGQAFPGKPGNDWSIQGTGDFNEDGQSDILWRNQDGTVAIWFMNDGTNTGQAFPGNPGSDWSIRGTGDFNADGTTDILWRTNNGNVVVWLMDRGAILTPAIAGTAGLDWTIQGVADFNGDRKSDILWRNQDGTVAIWFMDGGTNTGQAFPGKPGNDWVIQNTADFNNDLKGDILWRNQDGTVAIWFMDGGTNTGQAFPGKPGNDWVIQKTADFNGDRKSDILWRNQDGTVAIWFMDGGTNTGQAFPGKPGNDWIIRGVGGFNAN